MLYSAIYRGDHKAVSLGGGEVGGIFFCIYEYVYNKDDHRP